MEVIIARGNETGSPRTEGERINQQIQVQSVRLINHDGEMMGIVSLAVALQAAGEAELDLVEVSPNAEPPVCKILDFGKFKYETQKRRNEARKRQRMTEIKEIKLRPNIDSHDFDIKMRNVHRFLGEGDKVKVTLRFRGREMVHQELGFRILERVRANIGETVRIEHEPRMEGRQIVMIVAPK